MVNKVYNIEKSELNKENFFAGSFPIATDFGEIESGAKIRRHTPIVQGENGIKEAAEDTLDKVIGIAAAEPSGNEVVYYLTGEFFSQAIVLPNGVTIEALKPVLRKLTIFLKELNQHG
jgi:hypothetical protein